MLLMGVQEHPQWRVNRGRDIRQSRKSRSRTAPLRWIKFIVICSTAPSRPDPATPLRAIAFKKHRRRMGIDPTDVRMGGGVGKKCKDALLDARFGID